VARTGFTLVAVFALAAALFAGGSNAAYPGIPSIYVNYNDDCTFSMTADGGYTFTSSSPPGPTLPPGVYQILVLMPNPPQGYTCGTPVFTLSGPGVNSVTTFPQQATLDNHVLPALQPSSTYMAYDQNAPTATRVYFTTSATGSSSSLVTTTPSQTTGKGASQTDIVGSGITPVLGKLDAAIDSAGLATLSVDGRTVTSLKAGRYELLAVDPSRSSGLMLRKTGHEAETITSRAFKGKKTVDLTLTAGTWSVYAVPLSRRAAAPSFKVVG
jgi:hypothetical protein